MQPEVLSTLYEHPEYLEYLRKHPKWYYFLEKDPAYLQTFIKTVKKDLKITTYDKLEKMKKQVNFASAMLKYFTK